MEAAEPFSRKNQKILRHQSLVAGYLLVTASVIRCFQHSRHASAQRENATAASSKILHCCAQVLARI